MVKEGFDERCPICRGDVTDPNKQRTLDKPSSPMTRLDFFDYITKWVGDQEIGVSLSIDHCGQKVSPTVHCRGIKEQDWLIDVLLGWWSVESQSYYGFETFIADPKASEQWLKEKGVKLGMYEGIRWYDYYAQ